jgi:hypothetical protein
VFALSLYFACCFNTPQVHDGFLFPGKDQFQRYSEELQRCLKEHEGEVKGMGFNIHDIGTHSIRKGAVSYLASLPGGPTAASVCIRAGWSMGKIRDIYMRYVTAGDEFVGRCLSMLPVLRVEFGASPPYFTPEWCDFGKGLRESQFGMLSQLPNLSRVTLMCLASSCHHRAFVRTLAVNHVCRVASVFDRSAAHWQTVEANAVVEVTYPWSDMVNVYTGIPPHAVLLQELMSIKMDQRSMMESFIDKVKKGIEESGVGGNAMSEQRLGVMFERFSTDLREQLKTLDLERREGPRVQAEPQQDRVETGEGYSWHYFRGTYHRVPEDWRFPRIGVRDIWRQWWVGDTVRGIPPLRTLKAQDLKFLDKIPLVEQEMHGRSGRQSRTRRPARKTLSDLAFLMTYITGKVEVPEVLTLESVDIMFAVVSEEFQGGRNAQKHWESVVHDVRRLRGA